MSVENTNTLLVQVKQDGSLVQLSGQDVVPPSTLTDCGFSKKQLVVLLALFQGLLHNTFNPDVRELAVGWACGSLRGIMNEKEVKEIATKFMNTRQKSPMDMFF